MTLTEFLLARIAEDEADVKARAGRDVHRFECGEVAAEGHRECNCDMPARVLAECETKWRILKFAVPSVGTEQDWAYVDATFARTEEGDPHPLLTALALPYADHPDFQPEWRLGDEG